MNSTISDFDEDLKVAHKDEKFITTLLDMNSLDYEFTWVGDDEEHFHDGDIMISDGVNTYYADVKSDGVVHRTNNILAEHRVKFNYERSTGKSYTRYNAPWQAGFMQKCKYDYVFYLSKEAHKIWVLDFKLWQKYYKKHFIKHIEIPHNNKYGFWEQSTDGYCMPLKTAKKLGIVVAEISYDDNMCII